MMAGPIINNKEVYSIHGFVDLSSSLKEYFVSIRVEPITNNPTYKNLLVNALVYKEPEYEVAHIKGSICAYRVFEHKTDYDEARLLVRDEVSRVKTILQKTIKQIKIYPPIAIREVVEEKD